MPPKSKKKKKKSRKSKVVDPDKVLQSQNISSEPQSTSSAQLSSDSTKGQSSTSALSPTEQELLKSVEPIIMDPHPLPTNTSESIEAVHKLYGHLLRITCTDQRQFVGFFHSLDSQANILLKHVIEYCPFDNKSLSEPVHISKYIPLVLFKKAVIQTIHADSQVLQHHNISV